MRLLLSKTYPYTAGKKDALVVVSVASLKIPDGAVILPPFPERSLLPDAEIFRTIEVDQSELSSEYGEVPEISPESFIAKDSPNPNQAPVKEVSEVAEEMEAKVGSSKPAKSWDDFIGGGGSNADSD